MKNGKVDLDSVWREGFLYTLGGVVGTTLEVMLIEMEYFATMHGGGAHDKAGGSNNGH